MTGVGEDGRGERSGSAGAADRAPAAAARGVDVDGEVVRYGGEVRLRALGASGGDAVLIARLREDGAATASRSEIAASAGAEPDGLHPSTGRGVGGGQGGATDGEHQRRRRRVGGAIGGVPRGEEDANARVSEIRLGRGIGRGLTVLTPAVADDRADGRRGVVGDEEAVVLVAVGLDEDELAGRAARARHVEVERCFHVPVIRRSGRRRQRARRARLVDLLEAAVRRGARGQAVLGAVDLEVRLGLRVVKRIYDRNGPRTAGGGNLVGRLKVRRAEPGDRGGGAEVRAGKVAMLVHPDVREAVFAGTRATDRPAWKLGEPLQLLRNGGRLLRGAGGLLTPHLHRRRPRGTTRHPQHGRCCDQKTLRRVLDQAHAPILASKQARFKPCETASGQSRVANIQTNVSRRIV